jgi:acyl-ACP thioesterase
VTPEPTPTDGQELPGPAPGGRVYSESHLVGPADVTPAGRMRLDEIARWLQDVAFGDLVDAGHAGEGFWIVRRTRIVVERFPGFAEDLRLATFCTGASPLAAERRTSIEGSAGAAVEAVSIWVNLDPETRMPARLPEGFHVAYGAAAAGRRARSRLRHPPPPTGATSRPWTFRHTDLDLAGHVNNAVYWELVEECLEPDPPASLDAEIEYRSAALPGAATVLADGDTLWVTGAADEVLASARIARRAS